MAETVQLEINADVYEAARRVAKLDNVDVSTLVEDLVRRHAEYVATLRDLDPAMPAFDLNQLEMPRDQDEPGAEYESRPSLFR
jgi:antitoxin component of RelBE/YafQ-DinJ toxin-antitoxin module